MKELLEILLIFIIAFVWCSLTDNNATGCRVKLIQSETETRLTLIECFTDDYILLKFNKLNNE